MYNILVHIPHPEDSTSWYRGMGVIAHWRKMARNLQFSMVNKYNWTTVQTADILFMQRPCSKDHVEIARMAKRGNIPLWIDYDDYLMGVPTDNPTYFTYADEEIQTSIATLLSMADVVTVTTEHLAKLYQPLCGRIRVVPNCLNEQLFGTPVTPRETERQKLIVWRGSRTHQRDMLTVAPHLIELSKSDLFKEWIYCFLGDNMWFVTDQTPHHQTIVSKPLHVDEFNFELSKLKPTAIYVPLHDSDFNRAKSNIAWIEGTYAGAVTIAPDWPEWQQPGVLNFKTPEEFKLIMESVMAGDVDVRGNNQQSWERIQSEYTLKKWNYVRTEIAASLLNIGPLDILKG